MVKRILLTLIAIFFTACCLQPNLVYAGWHEWSQRARNQAITEAAYKDLNVKVGLNCKKWASKVVKSASNGTVTLPATSGTYPWYYWEPSKDVASRSGRIEDAKPGEILQMYTTYGLHTAIVWVISPFSVTFIESNWCPNECLIVRTRKIDFVDFYKQVSGGKFTINTIL